MNAPDWPPFDPLAGLKFETATGRMEIYAEKLADLGHGFAKYFPPMESPVIDENNEKYPYQFFTGRQRFFMQSMYTDDPMMVELSGNVPSARINPIDAARENIKDGDKVDVYNDRGHVVAIMRLDEAIPPKTIQVWFGWRQRQFEEGTYSELLVPLGDDVTLNYLSDRWWSDWSDIAPMETAYSGGATTATGAWDTIWDCACALRKVEDGKGALNG
jgi:molybdopterin-containing oxidoreductase family molybdopterin binding subunit